MKLRNIFRSTVKSDVLNSLDKLDINTKKIWSRNYGKTEELYYGKHSFKSLSKQLDNGDLHKFLDRMEITDINTRKVIHAKYLKEIKDNPIDKINYDLKHKVYKLEKAVRENPGPLTKLPRNNKRVDSIIKSMKKIIYVGVATGGVITIYSLIDKRQQEMNGCFRYELIAGELKICKVMSSSCYNNQINPLKLESIPFCDAAVIEAHMIGGDCTSSNNASCINCHADPIKISPSLDEFAGNSVYPNVYYRCNEASWTDAIADICGDKFDAVVSMATDIKDFAVDIGQTIFQVLKVLGVCITVLLICGSIYYFKYGRTSRHMNTEMNRLIISDIDNEQG